MDFAQTLRQSDITDPFTEIRALGLERHVAELEAYGYTVVEPERVGPPGFIDELRDALLDLAERDLAQEAVRGRSPRKDVSLGARGHHMHFLLGRGEVFEKALMNRVSLALVTYLLGRPARRRARELREAQARASAAPDGGGEAPADAVAPVRKEP